MRSRGSGALIAALASALPSLLASCGGSGDVEDLQSAISEGRLDTVSIEVQSSQDKLTLAPGEVWQFLAFSTDSNGVRTQISGEPVSWSSSDERLATITEEGIATMGDTTGVEDVDIRAEFSRYTDALTVTVSNAELVSLSIAPETNPLPECQNTPFSATGTFADGTQRPLEAGVSWRTDNADLATFDNNLLRTFNSGTVNALASSDEGISAEFPMTLTDTLSALVPSTGSQVMLMVDGTETVTALGDYSDGTSGLDITGNSSWSSSATNVAMVDAGLVTAVALGTSVVSVSCGGLVSEINVDVVEVDDIAIVNPEPELILSEGDTLQLELYRTFSNEELDTVNIASEATWSITAGAAIAAVDGNGLITMVEDFFGFPGETIRVQASFENFTDEEEISIDTDATQS
ncbi:MAG: hypothetical protein AAF662_13260 [Pseudomonadota bacterium]